MLQLDYRDTRPLYEQMKDGIRRLLLAGAVLPGEPMLSVGELSSRMAVNPETIGRAYRELEAEGYLRRDADGMIFVSDFTERENAQREKLMKCFDELVQKLSGLAVSEEELVSRVERLMKVAGRGYR